MKTFHRMIAVVACAAPLVAIAQTSSSGTKAAEPVERKQTTETGQSTTYGQSGAKTGSKTEGGVDKEKDKITKGDGATKATPAKPLDEPSAAKTPAKEGAQGGPQK